MTYQGLGACVTILGWSVSAGTQKKQMQSTHVCWGTRWGPTVPSRAYRGSPEEKTFSSSAVTKAVFELTICQLIHNIDPTNE
jgi:hypothetical protein